MKNILIVGAGIIDKPHAAGITVRSIFDGIDPKHVMGLDWRESASNMTQTSIKVLSLSYGPFSPARILDSSRMKKASRTIKKTETVSTADSTQKDYQSVTRSIIRDLRQWVALIPARSKIRIGKKEMKEIKSFDPKVIYTVGESVASLRLTYTLSKELNIPIVIHFMDNWKHSIEWAANPLLKGYQRQLSHYCDLCCTRTTDCIAIGDRMAEAYERETGIRHTVIMNSIDTEAFYCTPRENDSITRFVYAGGLHLGRDQALRTIGECIETVCNQENKKAEFLIYTSEDNIDFFSKQFDHLQYTHFHPAVPHNQIHDIYQHADVLIHVESSALYNNNFFKYSVSTKVSEYLATGRAFLFFGPSDIYLFDFLNRNRLAYTASNKEEAKKVINELISRTPNQYAQNARKYAQDHFDLSTARQRFSEVIEKVTLPKQS